MNEVWVFWGNEFKGRRLDTVGDIEDLDIGRGNAEAIENGDWDLVSYATFESYLENIKKDIYFKDKE
jgi:hypothetical protein